MAEEKTIETRTYRTRMNVIGPEGLVGPGGLVALSAAEAATLAGLQAIELDPIEPDPIEPVPVEGPPAETKGKGGKAA